LRANNQIRAALYVGDVTAYDFRGFCERAGLHHESLTTWKTADADLIEKVMDEELAVDHEAAIFEYEFVRIIFVNL